MGDADEGPFNGPVLGEEIAPMGLHAPSGPKFLSDDSIPSGLSGVPTKDLEAKDLEALRQIQRESKRRVDWVRAMIGLLLLLMLAFAVIAPWVSVWIDTEYFDEVKELLPLVTTPLVGLIGAAMGFYFGERRGETDHRTEL